METQEQINKVLSTAGEDLVFPSFTIKGIPGHEVYSIQGYDSPYDIKKQDLFFQISLYELKTHSIAKNNTFYYTAFGRKYNFSIDSFVDTLDGWIELQVTLGTIENV